MRDLPTASIVINNYNYARFLRPCIDSALRQTYPQVEVIVVDDGSTDDSRQIISSYGDHVIPILKDNGGQASAFNRAIPHCNGYAVLFLDSDDTVDPTAVERAMERLANPAVVKVQWRLRVVDESGAPLGRFLPESPMSEGDLRDNLLRDSPEYVAPPQSGNMWTSRFLRRVLPLPEEELKTGGADAYLTLLCIPFGHVASIPEPMGAYRLHGNSHYSSIDGERRLALGRRRSDVALDALARHCHAMGLPADAARWKRNSWLARQQTCCDEIRAMVPCGEAVIVIDGGALPLAEVLADRRMVQFCERDGVSWGLPADSEAAIVELERLRHAGARFIVFTWTEFWWLTYYDGFIDYLRSRYRSVAESDRLVAFDLREPARSFTRA